jgi:hypothetical protein
VVLEGGAWACLEKLADRWQLLLEGLFLKLHKARVGLILPGDTDGCLKIFEVPGELLGGQ